MVITPERVKAADGICILQSPYSRGSMLQILLLSYQALGYNRGSSAQLLPDQVTERFLGRLTPAVGVPEIFAHCVLYSRFNLIFAKVIPLLKN